MNQVIESYESLSAITALMREAAAQGQWDRLIELENECRQRVETMKSADAPLPELNETSRKRKVELIHKILADDAAIRSHTEPWMDQLQRIMHNAKVEQRVRQAYSGGSRP
jgi:flagellar protein FliT